jgi:hypothetical protein
MLFWVTGDSKPVSKNALQDACSLFYIKTTASQTGSQNRDVEVRFNAEANKYIEECINAVIERVCHSDYQGADGTVWLKEPYTDGRRQASIISIDACLDRDDLVDHLDRRCVLPTLHVNAQIVGQSVCFSI